MQNLLRSPDWEEAYEERAGIMEFDGGLARSDAERRAREIIDREAKDWERRPTWKEQVRHTKS